MNRFLKTTALLLSSAALVSCGGGAEEGLTLFRTRYDNGKCFEEICLSATDSTEVYMTPVAVANHQKDAVKFSASDFRMVIGDKEYSPEFFVLSYQMQSVMINGKAETRYYVVESATERSVPVTETEMTNLVLAFETFTEGEFRLNYKGSEISLLQ